MILIAVYWLFLFILLLPLGIVTKHALQLKTQNTVITILLGIVLLTCCFTLTAFFFPLGGASFLVWSCISLASGIYYRGEIKPLLKSFGKSIIQLPSCLKMAMGILTVGALLKSAQYPFIIDNESYYIQTIKWLNQYGFVKGLANLHVFFAQNSGWHVLQAGVNFSCITNKINDINGFVFLLCSLYCITESQSLSEGKKIYWLGFMPLLSALLFQFLSAPSPDLPLLVITPIILHLYLQQTEDNSNFKIALLLFIFLVSIKLTILPLGLLFLSGLLKKENIRFALVTGLPIMLLWAAKNTVICGYPLYPIAFFKTGFNWAIPDNLFRLIIDATSDYGYQRNGKFLPPGTSMITKLLLWIQQNGLARIINLLTLAVLFAMPFSMIKNKRYRIVYVALLVNFLAVLFTSPQFRYFLYITLCGCLFVAAAVYNYLKANIILYKTTIIAGSLLVFATFINFGFSGLTTNKYHQRNSVMRLQQLCLPEGITKYPDMHFIKCTTYGLEHYSPQYNFFRFGTANGPLPCVNQDQLKYFRKQLNITPKLRGNHISDGFISVQVSNY